MSKITSKQEPAADILNAACPSRTVLRHLTDRWAPMIITVLAQHDPTPVRFGKLRELIGGISGKVLTETLRSMQRDGMINRDITPTIPPRVDYALTPLGQSAVAPISALRQWAETHVTEIEINRDRYDQEQLQT